MGEQCSVCGVPVAGASILYTPDGRIVCPACFSKIAPVTDVGRAPWRTFAIAGGVIGAIPFAVNFSTSSSTTVNGEVTSFVYRDWIAVAAGVVAIMLGAIAVAAARKEQLQRGLAFAAGIGVVLLGGVQIARGFGVFADPGSSGGSQTSMSITTTRDEPTLETPQNCADGQACLDLGLALSRTERLASAHMAFERACELGSSPGCFNAGQKFLELDPPALAKAEPWLIKACDKRDGLACANLGRIYATDGPTKDMEKAKVAFEKSCGDGNWGEGCELLGMVFDQGLDGKQDFVKARSWFEEACTRGRGDSCFFLGQLRRNALGGPKDAEGAMAAYTDGCNKGNQDACKAMEEKPAAPPAKKKNAKKKKGR
jgi:hypothetical protein